MKIIEYINDKIDNITYRQLDVLNIGSLAFSIFSLCFALWVALK